MRRSWVLGCVLAACTGGSVKIGDSATISGGTTGSATGAATGTATGSATGTATGTATGSTTSIPPGCGDGALAAPEVCDDGNNTPGDGCRADCAGIELCGDGLVDGAVGEGCDDGAANDDQLSDACRTDCARPGCGDGVVDLGSGESCDDANALTNDGCAACAIVAAATCGDGAWDIASGEECDDGNATAGDGCDAACQLEAPDPAACGDGNLDALEVCDDGNAAAGDGCNPTCTSGAAVSTWVGTRGQPGYVDATGLAAELGGIATLAIDNTWLYVADSNNLVIRRVALATGAVTTIAGDGTNVRSDDPVGTNAGFHGMSSIATDGTRLWVADGTWLTDCTIREISLACPNPGTDCFAVTTIAGGAGVGQQDGPALGGFSCDDLRGLTWWKDTLYFLDGNGATLRALDLGTMVVSTLAGQAYTIGSVDGALGTGLMESPRYMTHDNSGTLFIADTNGNKIRTYNTVTGWLGTFAGDGTAGYVDGVGTAARISRPRGMTSDGSSIYWVEFDDHTVRQGVIATRAVSTLVGQVGVTGWADGTGTAATFDSPFALARDWNTGRIYVVDGGNATIRAID